MCTPEESHFATIYIIRLVREHSFLFSVNIIITVVFVVVVVTSACLLLVDSVFFFIQKHYEMERMKNASKKRSISVVEC